MALKVMVGRQHLSAVIGDMVLVVELVVSAGTLGGADGGLCGLPFGVAEDAEPGGGLRLVDGGNMLLAVTAVTVHPPETIGMLLNSKLNCCDVILYCIVIARLQHKSCIKPIV